MPITRTLAILFISSLLCFGCTRGCSDKQNSGTTGNAMPSPPKPSAFFRINPAGAECASGQLCSDNDMYLLTAFSRDLAQPIDWTKESDDWRTNHDIEANLKDPQERNNVSSSCDTKQITSLYRTRQKLFFILRKLTEEDGRWKDATWFHNRPYYELLSSRDAARILPIFQKLSSVKAEIGIADQNLASDWRLFASELLRYYTMVRSLPDWEKRFNELAASDRNLVSGSHFHDAGFPKTDDVCHHLSHIFGGNYVVGYDQGLEGWFYSFWVRRYKEGTMDAVVDLLKWGVAAVPASADNTAAFTSSATVTSPPDKGRQAQ